MMVLVDGVLFQREDAGSDIAGECSLIVASLASAAARRGIALVLLDRGGLPPLPGVTTFPFPTYRATEAVADGLLVQRICEAEGVDVFVSTGLTVPLTTPTLQLIVGPDVASKDPKAETQDLTLEQEIALHFSAFVVCTSSATERRLRGIVRSSAMRSPPPGDEGRPSSIASLVLDLAPEATSVFASRGSGFMERWTALRHMQAALETTA